VGGDRKWERGTVVDDLILQPLIGLNKPHPYLIIILSYHPMNPPKMVLLFVLALLLSTAHCSPERCIE
jgi:hypothetical protein